MSRIGKKPIKIISGVNVRVESNRIFVKGPKGELERDIRPEISIEVNDEEIGETGDDGTISFAIPEDTTDLEIEAKLGGREGEMEIEFEEEQE